MERYEAYKDSGVEWIGKIPEGWDCCEIAYLSTCSNGATPSRDVPSYWNGDIPWMASGEIHQGYVTNTAEKITQEGLDNSSTRVLPINTVMIALNGQGKTKGTAAILGIEACSNQSLAGFVCNEAVLHYRWLYYCFGSMYGYLRGESGQAQRDGIAASSLKHEKIPLPPLVWQRAISDYLDAKTAEVDALVADCEREVRLLREYRKAVISEAVTKGLDPDAPMKDSGVEWIGEIPVECRIVRMKEVITDLRVGPFGSAIRTNDYADEGVPLYTQETVLERDWRLSKYLEPCKANELSGFVAKPGDMLITTRGSGTPGHVFELPEKCESGVIHPCLMRFRTKNGIVEKAFLNWVINDSSAIKNQIDQASSSSTIPVLYSDTLRGLYLALPDKEIQRKIVEYLDAKTAEIDSLIEAKQQMADKLREYRKSLISEAITGKFKVPGA